MKGRPDGNFGKGPERTTQNGQVKRKTSPFSLNLTVLRRPFGPFGKIRGVVPFGKIRYVPAYVCHSHDSGAAPALDVGARLGPLSP